MFQISTCTHRCELPNLLQQYKVGVEVGVLHGSYANVLLGRWPGYLHLIDPWEDYPEYNFGGLVSGQRSGIQDHVHNYQLTRAVLLSYPESRYRIWRARNSEHLASCIGNVDFAYIDGNHDLEYVQEDIRIWWNRLNPGGMLAGHDLFQVDHPGVTEAVVLHAAKYHCLIYIILGRDGCPCNEGGVPSWYMFKN